MSWHDQKLTTHFLERARHEAAFHAARERRREKDKQDAKDDRRESAADDLISVAEQAAELREITERLDAIELQVTQALLENDQRLDANRERIDQLLSEATVLPDGRRVFRTEDGTQVFDEFGEEISPEELDPGSIPDENPSWEEFQGALEERAALEAERERLLELQGDIDAARDAAEAGELEPDDLDALEAEFGAIEADMDAAPEPDPTTPAPPTAPVAANVAKAQM